MHFDRVAQVGLVRAVPKRRVSVGNLRPLGIDLAAAAELFEHASQHRLDCVEHVLLLDKGHLHVQLIEIRR